MGPSFLLSISLYHFRFSKGHLIPTSSLRSNKVNFLICLISTIYTHFAWFFLAIVNPIYLVYNPCKKHSNVSYIHTQILHFRVLVSLFFWGLIIWVSVFWYKLHTFLPIYWNLDWLMMARLIIPCKGSSLQRTCLLGLISSAHVIIQFHLFIIILIVIFMFMFVSSCLDWYKSWTYVLICIGLTFVCWLEKNVTGILSFWKLVYWLALLIWYCIFIASGSVKIKNLNEAYIFFGLFYNLSVLSMMTRIYSLRVWLGTTYKGYLDVRFEVVIVIWRIKIWILLH